MKERVREAILKQRSNMSADEVRENSIRIQERLYSTQHYQSAQTIMTYVDIQNEVETKDIIKNAFIDGKNVAVPLCGANYSLEAFKINDIDDLEPGTKGIMEPKSRKSIVEIDKIDLVIVPGIAFDRKGNRLGYGLAYYDRFIKELSPATVTIALAYSFQIIPEIVEEDHDEKVNMIITEKEIIRCIM